MHEQKPVNSADQNGRSFMPDRRQMLTGLGAAGAAALTGGAFASSGAQPGAAFGFRGLTPEQLGWDAQRNEYTLPPLPYDYDALEPHIDEQTMRLHHDKHHAGYVRGLNAALARLAEIREGSRDTSETKHCRNSWRSTDRGTFCMWCSGTA